MFRALISFSANLHSSNWAMADTDICATQKVAEDLEDCQQEMTGTNGTAAAEAENGTSNHANGTDSSIIWGRLLSINDTLPSIELQNAAVSIGRSKSCDVCLPGLKRSQQISMHHFTLLRMPHTAIGSDSADASRCASNGRDDEKPAVTNGNGDCGGHSVETVQNNHESSVAMVTVLRDHSTYGTFVDGVKIGKDKQALLQNNQVISLLSPNNRCWMYTACNSSELSDLPKLPASIADKFVVSKQLGEGGFGKVLLAYEIGTCQPCAIKVINKRDLFYLNASEIERAIQTQEVKNLVSIRHPNIIRVLDFINEIDEAFILLEYMAGGDLYDKIEECKRLSEAQTKHIGYQLAGAILYLHENNITHRDIKPENVLLVDKTAELPTVKLTDFGLSKLLHKGTMLRTVCGTPGYTAPEIGSLEDDQSYTSKCDVYSLGALLFACLFGRSYTPESDAEMLALAAAADSDSAVAVSPAAAGLLLSMLEPLPDRRLAMADVVDHDWFAECRLDANAAVATTGADLVDADATAVIADSDEANGEISIPTSEDAAKMSTASPLASEPTRLTAASPKTRNSARMQPEVAGQSPSRSARRKRSRQQVDDGDEGERQHQQVGGGGGADAAEAADEAEPQETGSEPAPKRWRGWGCQLL